MSTQQTFYSEYGVLFTDDDVAEVVEAKGLERFDEIADDFLVDYGDYGREVSLVRPDGSETDYPGLDEKQTIYVGQSRKCFSPFNQAYQSFQELVDEMKASYGEFVSESFPWKDRIVHYEGTSWG